MRMEREHPVGHLRGCSDWLSISKVEAGDCSTGGRVRPIIRMPDPLLRRAARGCAPGDPGVAEAARDLVRTMALHPACRALSAPQIGRLLRIVAVDLSPLARLTGPQRPEGPEGAPAPVVLVNPQLVVASGLRTEPERCLSIPNVVATVRRADDILVIGFSPEGGTATLELQGTDAALLLHELDHLDGVLMLDRLESLSDLSPLAAHQPPGEPPRLTPYDPFGHPSA